MDAPYSNPDGDINNDAAIDVLDTQLAVNIFLGTETNATLIGRADTRPCNTGNIITNLVVRAKMRLLRRRVYSRRITNF